VSRAPGMLAHGTTPILNVSDLAASFAWFERLGWSKLWEYGDPPDFGAVGSGRCEIFLSLDGQGGRGESGVWMSVWVDDVDVVHETCVAQGLDVTRPPTDEPWGVREMHVRHPDGHVFRIGRGHDHNEGHDHGHGHAHAH
jgi:catechol 2,3-dioxygenase-like lactoylglutathione lyase family enzyme